MTTKEVIFKALKSAKKPLTVKEIQKLTGLKYNTIRGRLYELKKEGLVKRVKEGWVVSEQ